MKSVFVSVGTMMPFDRLCRAMDEWAQENPDVKVEMQIGKTNYEPKSAQWCRLMDLNEYHAKINAADVFVGHCGMGSIISAIEAGKPLVMLPRLNSLGEHNTDHQLATAKYFGGRKGLYVSNNESELKSIVSKLIGHGSDVPDTIKSTADERFLASIAKFIDNS